MPGTGCPGECAAPRQFFGRQTEKKLEYIYKARNAAANGHETLDTDSSAVVIVSYPRIEGATGLPARVWAITE